MAKTTTITRPTGPLRTPEEKKARKQARARARRNVRRAEESLGILYKPLEEWDDEELARGQPRDISGNFNNKPPSWVSRAVHEEAIRRFTDLTTGEMRAIIPTALATIQLILTSQETDNRGRPLVPYGVKLDASKWVIEHLVGKPTQRVESEISVRLQGLLANVVVGENEQGQLGPAIDAEWSQEDDDSDLTTSDDD